MSRKMLFSMAGLALVLIAGWYSSKRAADTMIDVYTQRQSFTTHDRYGATIAIQPNGNGYYAVYGERVPERFAELLLTAEDRYFYYHPGLNPGSIVRASYRRLTDSVNPASSTITQQLAKILRNSESDRTIKNKFAETLYAIGLELHASKEELLQMYANSVYFGNRTQGLAMASAYYFNATPESLTDEQSIQLIATIASPSKQHPFTAANGEQSKQLAKRIGISVGEFKDVPLSQMQGLERAFRATVRTSAAFELGALDVRCANTWIDQKLTEDIRAAAQRAISSFAHKNATHAAVVVLKQPENQLIAMVGTPRPDSELQGDQINMALKPRPIGSTVKPLIYLKGFEQNLRPYTIVDDKEYKYTIGNGYALYPKNYDFAYHGPVTLHYALANSLNVPSVKVLEYVGLENFYDFLLTDLSFQPIQDLREYQLSIALGGLEMDLLALTYYTSLFANNGALKPLELCQHQTLAHQSQTRFNQHAQIADEAYVQLVNKILTDRTTGVEQFGLVNDLIIPGVAIAAKTGTSREFHDSWTIGYTPDFVVGVWLGNTENTAMDEVSGSAGAGAIWHNVMELLISSGYNRKTPFRLDAITEFRTGNTIEYGLAADDYEAYQKLLTTNELILSPHDGDTFLLERNTRIPLRASVAAAWLVNGEPIGEGSEMIFKPTSPGTYTISAQTSNQSAQLLLHVRSDE